MSFIGGRLAVVGVLGVAGLFVACTSSVSPVPPTRVAPREAPFLLDPVATYPAQIDTERGQRVRSAYQSLLDSATDLAGVESLAGELLAADPELHPATVLLAQVHLLRRDDRLVLEALEPIAIDFPDYSASQMALGRAAERSGDQLRAFRAFRAIAHRSSLAAEREKELLPGAVEQAETNLWQAVDRGQLEDAETWLAELISWLGFDDPRILAAEQGLAHAAGDRDRELDVIRRQLAQDPRRDLRMREGELVTELGDVRLGLRIFEELVTEDPDDREAAERLARAKFLWRLQVLPAAVQELGERPLLDRSDLATLLFWLVPSVRYAPIDNPPIATDILDHPRRDEIVRVTNLGLMRVDQSLHRFDPKQPVARSTVLYALLMLLQSSDRPLACLLDENVETLGRSVGLICSKAAECRLLPEVGECLPAAEISGSEALELFRVGLQLLGSG